MWPSFEFVLCNKSPKIYCFTYLLVVSSLIVLYLKAEQVIVCKSGRIYAWKWMGRDIKVSDFIWLFSVAKFEGISIQTNQQEIKNNYGAVFWWRTATFFYMFSIKCTRNYGLDYIVALVTKMTAIHLNPAQL